ncbi:MAG: hypothetical protein MI824_11575 [Hyphomicrobiales bacterium]|nr:hypothetical protein [Hyphomicrobiales bacterium]
MSQGSVHERRHEEFLRQQHDRRLVQTSVEANAAAAELIAERIAAKLAEQNDIIYQIGRRQGRTTVIAYISMVIAGVAAFGQLFGPLWAWPAVKQFFQF